MKFGELSNRKYLERISDNAEFLSRVFGESVLFLSKPKNREKLGESSIMLLIPRGEDDDEGYLEIRRLLNDLKYHLKKRGNLDLDFTLTRGVKDE